MTHRVTCRLLTIALAVCASTVLATEARAQAYVAPLLGYDFGGDTGCPELSQIPDCQNKPLNYGVAFGAMGSLVGVEQEIAFAHEFFGEAPALSSSVLTVMSSLIIGPNLKVARPYVLFGMGLIKTHIELTPSSLLTLGDNHFGWNIGGGLMIFFGGHVGIRGDIRYFHTFSALDTVVIQESGVTFGGSKLDFGRVAGALVLQF
jgi:hypothetical protein